MRCLILSIVLLVGCEGEIRINAPPECEHEWGKWGEVYKTQQSEWSFGVRWWQERKCEKCGAADVKQVQ